MSDKVFKGNLDLDKTHRTWYKNLEIIKGDCIYQNAPNMSHPFPDLKVIEGDLDLRDSGVYYLPKLEYVGGNIYFNENTALQNFGVLKTVKGKVSFGNNSRLKKMFVKSFQLNKSSNQYERKQLEESLEV